MSGSFRDTILYIMAVIVIAIFLPANSHAAVSFHYSDPDPKNDWGAVIMSTNCDPAADPALDYQQTYSETIDGIVYYPTRSCVGQGISMSSENDSKKYKVHVWFKPTSAFVTAYVFSNLSLLIAREFQQYWAVRNSAYAATMTECTSSCAALVASCEAGSLGIGTVACAGVGATCTVRCPGEAEVAAESAGFNFLVGSMVANIAVASVSAVSASRRGDAYLNLGSITGMLQGPLSGGASDVVPVANADVRIVGQYACVYMQSYPIPFVNFVANRIPDFDEHYKIGATSPLKASNMRNCVYMPLMSKVVKPQIPTFISSACLDADKSATQFRWKDPDSDTGNAGKSRAFMGLIVQCIQESMMNLFFNKHTINGTQDTQTIFEKLQSDLKYMIMLMMVLYVIFIGFKYISYQAEALKKEEFIKMMLKIGLVWYFSLGAGVIQWFPGLINSIQTMGAVVIDAAATGDSYDTQGNNISHPISANNAAATTQSGDKVAREDTIEKLATYNAAKATYNLSRKSWAVAGATGTPPDPTAMNNAYAEYQRANALSLSYGYNYCNFTNFVSTLSSGKNLYRGVTITPSQDTEAPYNATSPTPGTVVGPTRSEKTYTTGNNSYMQVWDSIDCRLARYMGFGSDSTYPSQPATLMWAAASLLSGPVGIIVFALMIVFLIFVMLIVVRVVHIYIVAFVALVLLVYISPLALAFMLFEFTKDTVDAWIKQVFAYSMQPVILFTFLAFMFAMFDNIIYGDNQSFNQTIFNGDVPTISLNDNMLVRTQDTSGNWRCQDETVIGCMVENIGVKTNNLTAHDAIRDTDGIVFSYYSLYNKSGMGRCVFPETSARCGISTGITSVGSTVSQTQYANMLVEMLKLTFMCFIIYYLMEQIEDLTSTITNIGMGATQLSSAPNADPGKIAAKTVVPALKKAGGAGMKAGGAAFNRTAGAAGRYMQRDKLSNSIAKADSASSDSSAKPPTGGKA